MFGNYENNISSNDVIVVKKYSLHPKLLVVLAFLDFYTLLCMEEVLTR